MTIGAVGIRERLPSNRLTKGALEPRDRNAEIGKLILRRPSFLNGIPNRRVFFLRCISK